MIVDAIVHVAVGLGGCLVVVLLNGWVAPRSSRTVQRFLPGLTALGIGAVLWVQFGADKGTVPLGFAVVLLVAASLGYDVPAWVERVVHIAQDGLRWLLGSLLFGVVIVPAWAWASLRRKDVLRGSQRREVEWLVAPNEAKHSGSLAAAGFEESGRRSLGGRLTWAVGCALLILAADYGAGVIWDRLAPDGVVQATVADATGGTVNDLPPDPRAELGAMAAYPWRDRYFDDIRRTSGGYWPFTESRPDDFSSPYVNIEGWSRKSYEASESAEGPSVWMFGGSTTWGEGQRDEYTIASWLVRLSERDQLPISIENYGQRGWTHFQEMILYEQRLAEQPPPDLAMFYDGANEINAQSLMTEAVPTHTLAYTYALELTGSSIATEFVQESEAPSLTAQLWDAYTRHSVLYRASQLATGRPVGASVTQEDDAGDGFTRDQNPNEDGQIYNYATTPQDGIDAGKVYERGKHLTLDLSERYGVDPLLLWQPIGFKGDAERNAIEQLTDPTIDISDALSDHDEVFIDGGHTNEEGARIVAERIWVDLKPLVQRWYEEQS